MARVLFLAVISLGCALSQERSVLTGSQLAVGLDAGVDTDRMRRDWLLREADQWRLAYPAGQAWGAVFVTVGTPVDPPRPFQDFSTYDTLVVEMRGESPGTRVEIGVKDATQPDTGAEVKVPVVLGTAWATHSFRLDQYRGADLKRLYVVTEFVFAGAQAQTVLVRSVKFIVSPRLTPQTRVRPCDPEPTNMEIIYGDLIECAIESAGDSDLFRFTAQAEKISVLVTRRAGSNADQCFRVVSPSGAPGPYSCVVTFFNGVRSPAASQELTITQAGVHTIQIVDGSSNEVLAYNLGLTRLFPVQSNAPPVSWGDVVPGEIAPLGDVDFFQTSPTAGELLTVNLTRESGNADFCARWIDTAGSYGAWVCAATFFNGVRAQNINFDKRIAVTGRHVLQIVDSSADEVFRYRVEIQCVGPRGACSTGDPLRVVNAASGGDEIGPGTWISIFGQNLSRVSRAWRSEDFSDGRLPVTLEGTNATLGGRPLAIAYVSPTQLNALTPPDLSPGPTRLIVRTESASFEREVLLLSLAPAFFTLSIRDLSFAAAVHTDGTLVAPVDAIPGVVTRPARPGDTILLFGTGFGPTSPPVSSDTTFSGFAPLADTSQFRLRIGGLTADLRAAGAVGNGLYQFNVVVPPVADGNQPVASEINGRSTPGGPVLAVRRQPN